MVIRSYIGFDEKYQQLDSKTCQWFRVNFKGSEFRVIRSGSELSVSAHEIKEGDQLVSISRLPESLKKISIVTDPLKAELKRRGFNRFEIASENRSTPRYVDEKRIDTERANQLVERVAENTKFREEAAEAIELFLDNARKGIINEKQITGFLEELIDKSSTEALSAIASLKKSDQTYGHCVDVSAIYSNTYLKIIENNQRKSAFVDEKELAFAGFMHDFGKAKIPKEILDATIRFELNSPEIKMLRTHPRLGAELVEEMTGSKTILNMVLWHHLKLDPTINSSYPEKPEDVEVSRETRLLSIVDAYQALIGRRSYKRAWSPASAVRYLDSLAGIEYDLSAWENFLTVMGTYPVSSLVELSDKSVAFVVNNGKEDPDNPQVVVVQDADGNWLDTHEILYLSQAPEMRIIRDLDAQDHFGDEALNAFTRIRLT